jgi:hypothetical protein
VESPVYVNARWPAVDSLVRGILNRRGSAAERRVREGVWREMNEAK